MGHPQRVQFFAGLQSVSTFVLITWRGGRSADFQRDMHWIWHMRSEGKQPKGLDKLCRAGARIACDEDRFSKCTVFGTPQSGAVY